MVKSPVKVKKWTHDHVVRSDKGLGIVDWVDNGTLWWCIVGRMTSVIWFECHVVQGGK